MSRQDANSRNFWIVTGIGAALCVGLLVGWVMPANSAANEAEKELQRLNMEFGALRSTSDDLVAGHCIQAWQDYRKWLQRECAIMENFFIDRASLLNAPIAGEGTVSPAAFKDAYISCIKTQQQWFEQNKDRMKYGEGDARQAFFQHDWMRGEGAPKPADFAAVQRDYWARVHVYQLLLNADVKVIRRMEVMKLKVLPVPEFNGQPIFNGLPVKSTVIMAPEKVAGLIDRLLNVSTTTVTPVFGIERMEIRPEAVAGRPLCAVDIDGYVLLFNGGKQP